MKFGLTEETISKINSVFKIHAEINEAILYGSRAKGIFRNGSDIDLTLKGNDLSKSLISILNTEIDELNTPYLIDISIYNLLNSKDLEEHIDRVGMIFYKR